MDNVVNVYKYISSRCLSSIYFKGVIRRNFNMCSNVCIFTTPWSISLFYFLYISFWSNVPYSIFNEERKRILMKCLVEVKECWDCIGNNDDDDDRMNRAGKRVSLLWFPFNSLFYKSHLNWILFLRSLRSFRKKKGRHLVSVKDLSQSIRSFKCILTE